MMVLIHEDMYEDKQTLHMVHDQLRSKLAME